MSMVDNIVQTYKSSTAEQRRIGAAWYPTAYHNAALLDPENPARAAGVIAALSPQTGWKRNLSYASQVIAWADSGKPVSEAPNVHFTTQMAKAIAIARFETPPLEALHGPKERSFYGAIMGYPDAVVIDRWAARVAEPEKCTGGKNERVTEAQYRRISAAYVEAAHKFNRPVRDVQSVVWFATRTIDA